jgi:hypothetical protein
MLRLGHTILFYFLVRAPSSTDLALVGSTMQLAASSGFSLRDLLGSEATARSLASHMISQFQGSSVQRNEREFSGCPFQGQPLEGQHLPACTAWMHEDLSAIGLGPPRIYVMRVSNNGDMTFFLNKLFVDELSPIDAMQATMLSKQPPPFIHPDDCHKISVSLDMWKSLLPPVSNNDGSVERMVIMDVPNGLRLLVRQNSGEELQGRVDGFRCQHTQTQLVVINSELGGQVSYHVIVSRDYLDRRPQVAADVAFDSPTHVGLEDVEDVWREVAGFDCEPLGVPAECADASADELWSIIEDISHSM